ncbi:hypothetical protein DFJ73DRAFT_757919 [Zopfochytrium polystomum]|nr:hypothetical protein DFJ73DRAFT_757919 [Zopfochytrium polystomum]
MRIPSWGSSSRGTPPPPQPPPTTASAITPPTRPLAPSVVTSSDPAATEPANNALAAATAAAAAAAATSAENASTAAAAASTATTASTSTAQSTLHPATAAPPAMPRQFLPRIKPPAAGAAAAAAAAAVATAAAVVSYPFSSSKPPAQPANPSSSSSSFTSTQPPRGAPAPPRNRQNPTPPPPPPPRRENRILPAYEEELGPDNSVPREPPTRAWYQKLVHQIAVSFDAFWGGSGRDKEKSSSSSSSSASSSSSSAQVLWTPYDVKKVAVIGVHGWFPGRLLKTVVGEPVGTSTRFADKMEQAARDFFFKRYGIKFAPDAITKMPLEGAGKVEDRVEMLFRQLLSKPAWVEKLREANLVLVAAHSQGTPVSAMLLAKLMKEGYVDTRRQRTCLLAMAGICHGPFPHMKSSVIVQYVESDPARQLFEFNDWNSPISKQFRSAIADILDAGARVVAVGSWYDQVVPVYSATMHAFNHPAIYRAIYIEGVDYNPDFLSHLVVFALRLRNVGISDRGLIVHLSEYLAGNVYGFGTQGHQTLYEELNTYMLAVAWAMGSGNTWKYASASPFATSAAETAALSPHERSLLIHPLLGKLRHPVDPSRFPNPLTNRRNSAVATAAGVAPAGAAAAAAAAKGASARARLPTGAIGTTARSGVRSAQPPLPVAARPNPGQEGLAAPLWRLLGRGPGSVTDPPPLPAHEYTRDAAAARAASARLRGGMPLTSAVAAADGASSATADGYSNAKDLDVAWPPAGFAAAAAPDALLSSSVPPAIGSVPASSQNSPFPPSTAATATPPPHHTASVLHSTPPHHTAGSSPLPPAPPPPPNINQPLPSSSSLPPPLHPNPPPLSSTSTPSPPPTPPPPPPPPPAGHLPDGFNAPSSRINPYWLPWILAQLLSDERILGDPPLRAALEDLLRTLDRWDPASRPLRDLWYRLEPLRARL